MPSPKKCSPVPPSVSSPSPSTSKFEPVRGAASAPPAAPAAPPPRPEVEPGAEPGAKPRRRPPSNAFSEPFLEKLRLALRLMEERNLRIPTKPATDSGGRRPGSERSDALRLGLS